jgi:carbonic anhydrase
MKNLKNLPPAIVVMLLIFSCNTATQPPVQTDSSQNGHETPSHLAVGNEVKSEAPDAVTKTEQGYAIPRDNDGVVQSPINILTDSTLKDSGQDLAIKFYGNLTAIENLGHTIQLDFKDGSTTQAGGKTWTSKQFHFHTPSEHLIDGMTYPMEMHIVSVLKDSNSQNPAQYLVLGILFKMGRENKFIKEFLSRIPNEEGKDTLPSGSVRFDDLFNSIPKDGPSGYYAYKGSLTTPPYSETVNWVVRKVVLEASPEQISTIEKMEGNNARHVQALYARKVVNHG